MKICNKCKVEKKLVEFGKDNRNNDDIRYICKLCIKVYSKKYIETNKELLKERDHNYYENNREIIQKRNNEYKKKRQQTDIVFRIQENIRKTAKYSGFSYARFYFLFSANRVS